MSNLFSEIKTKFPVVCESGKINITLQKLKSVDIDSYFSIITMKDSFGILIKSSLHAKVNVLILNKHIVIIFCQSMF